MVVRGAAKPGGTILGAVFGKAASRIRGVARDRRSVSVAPMRWIESWRWWPRRSVGSGRRTRVVDGDRDRWRGARATGWVSYRRDERHRAVGRLRRVPERRVIRSAGAPDGWISSKVGAVDDCCPVRGDND